jgi:WD40 repeat protein
MTMLRRSVWWLALLLAAPGAARAGNLFVSGNSSFPAAVLEYNGTTGASLGTFASGNGLSSPQGLAFGPNGNLFVSSSDGVLEFNGTTGAFITTFVTSTISTPVLSGPLDLVFGPNGDLFVSSSSTNAVLEYNGTTGAFVKAFASGSPLNNPKGLAFGPNGDLFVSNANTNSVLEFNGKTGALVGTFASGGGLVNPTYLVFQPSAIPEPSSLTLLACGCLLTGLAAARRRRGGTRA